MVRTFSFSVNKQGGSPSGTEVDRDIPLSQTVLKSCFLLRKNSGYEVLLDSLYALLILSIN